MKELSVYIHIPFCESKCYYCDFNSYTNKNSFKQRYIESVTTEVNLYNDFLKKHVIKTLYIGGGTPSTLNTNQIRFLLNKFDLTNIEEITIECNINSVDEEKLKAYRDMGINRISFGIQTFNNKLLKNIGRIHTSEQAEQVIKLANSLGFKNISCDLMIGLPNQTLLDVENSLNKLLNFRIQHISVYSLKIEEGTQFYKNSNLLHLPNEGDEREMFYLVCNKLNEYGYNHYEISNFSLPRMESKHNLTYWKCTEYIGFGAGAHSYINFQRYENEANIEKYIESLENNRLPVIEKSFISNQEQIKEAMLLGFRMLEGINITKINIRFGISVEKIFEKELNKLYKNKLIEKVNNYIKLTVKGIDFANQVFVEFV